MPSCLYFTLFNLWLQLTSAHRLSVRSFKHQLWHLLLTQHLSTPTVALSDLCQPYQLLLLSDLNPSCLTSLALVVIFSITVNYTLASRFCCNLHSFGSASHLLQSSPLLQHLPNHRAFQVNLASPQHQPHSAPTNYCSFLHNSSHCQQPSSTVSA